MTVRQESGQFSVLVPEGGMRCALAFAALRVRRHLRQGREPERQRVFSAALFSVEEMFLVAQLFSEKTLIFAG